MAIGNIEQPSLLASLLEKQVRDSNSNRSAVQRNGAFAEKLDKILATDAKSVRIDNANARSLAESLNLQMLKTTLALSGDQPAASQLSPLAERQAAAIKALMTAYAANQAGVSSQPETSPAPLQPLPEPEQNVAPVISTKAQVRAEKGGQWLEPLIAKASSRYGVDAGLIKAVIKAESNFNPNAVSHAGAQGLMQLMPATARSLGVTNSFDPEQNVMGGTRFLRDLLKRYDGDLDSALAAYNWGPGNVDKRPDRLPRETREYLVRVKQLYNSYVA